MLGGGRLAVGAPASYSSHWSVWNSVKVIQLTQISRRFFEFHAVGSASVVYTFSRADSEISSTDPIQLIYIRTGRSIVCGNVLQLG